ncbi:MAG: FkbM family methyltransferase [Candidatus Pelagibacter bacterium]|nr:FkbM family methyltransferase [Candidatus Pelagibacter bacterium]MBL6861212.1 FkbM family methyltransferase [Candidatus Pelagibacter bacterium]
MINLIKELASYLNRKIKSKKISYSLTSIDLVVDYIFKKNNGIYIDVGCNHPVYNNNTYLLNQKGWVGINIDIDKKSIELFNLFRKKDLNINLAISSKKTILEYINFHEKSPINKIKTSENQNLHSSENVKKIKSDTLDSIIEKSPFKNKKIDFVSIDVEGHEIEVIKGFNLKKYKPSIIVIEYLDTSLKKIEIKNFSLQNIINSEIYKLMINNNYHMVNWLHSDLIFAHNLFREN